MAVIKKLLLIVVDLDQRILSSQWLQKKETVR